MNSLLPTLSAADSTFSWAPLWMDLWSDAGGRLGAHAAVKDAETGRYLAADPGLTALLRAEGLPLVGAADADWADASTVVALRAADQTALGRDGVLASEHRFDVAGGRREFLVLRKAGDLGDIRVVASVWIDQVAQRRESQQLKQALEQIEQLQSANESLRLELSGQGLRDATSGLYARAHFDEQIRREVDLSVREQRQFALVFVAVDSPSVQSGVAAGAALNRVYEALGRLMRGNTRAMDAACRYDRDRFAVLLSGVGLAMAHQRMEGLRRQCATEIVVHEGREFGFTTSMGVASFPHTAQSQEALVLASEAALVEARKRGGNHVALAPVHFES